MSKNVARGKCPPSRRRRLLDSGALAKVESFLVYRFGLLSLCFCFVLPFAAFGGGTPDPGTSPLMADGGDADLLPDNENQLLGGVGSNRGFSFGDYVSDANDGLQSTVGFAAAHRFRIEVPPSQSTLVVEIFDADTGAGAVSGAEDYDHDAGTGWFGFVEYSLFNPSGAAAAIITLSAQDCDPITVGSQTGCDAAWSDLGVFSVGSPNPGHWTLMVRHSDLAGGSDDYNAYGVRAHDGDPSAGGTEFAVYVNDYLPFGQLKAGDSASDPGFSTTTDFYPYITQGCAFDVNDWDSDDDGDESLSILPPRTPAAPSMLQAFGADTAWNQAQITDFSTDEAARNQGVWSARWVAGAFNFMTAYFGDDDTVDPALPPTPPGNGAEPAASPLENAIRLYLPADGSRFFGERGGPDDSVVAPQKPWVSHEYAVISGPDPLDINATSRVRVTITVTNPTALPLQFSSTTSGTELIEAHIPTNAGQTVYVAGSPTISNAGAAAANDIAESGAGPWDLQFAIGVVDAGSSATATYDIDVSPSGMSTIDITTAGAMGTRARFLDGTCADAGGGTSSCTFGGLQSATTSFGPLCALSVDGGTIVPVELQTFSVD